MTQPRGAKLPYLAEDAVRLAPMIPFDQVAERKRLQDLKEFRQYLVDTGAVKCLMKLYQHTEQNEMRLDNPRLLKEFLGRYQNEGSDMEEVEQALRENAALKKQKEKLEQKCRELKELVDMEGWLKVGQELWRRLTHGERREQLELRDLFDRLCGANGAPEWRVELDQEGAVVRRDDFCAWAASALPEELRLWIRETLEPKMGVAGEVPVLEVLRKGEGQQVRGRGRGRGQSQEAAERRRGQEEAELCSHVANLQGFLKALVRRFGGGGGDD